MPTITANAVLPVAWPWTKLGAAQILRKRGWPSSALGQWHWLARRMRKGRGTSTPDLREVKPSSGFNSPFAERIVRVSLGHSLPRATGRGAGFRFTMPDQG